MTSALLTQHEATIYVEESVFDSRGNPVKRPSETGVVVRCYISPSTSARDRDGSTTPRWTFVGPPDVPLGMWSRVVAHGREFACLSWPRLAGPEGSGARTVQAELIEQR